MSSTFVNAAPQTLMLGTLDLSTRALVSEPEALPTHLPKVYGFAKKGPLTPELVSGVSRTNTYGADSFDERLAWATHGTVLSNAINEEGNAQVFQRLKPDDAAPPAGLRLYADVLPTDALPVYQRNADGTVKRDINGAPIQVTGQTGTVTEGFKIKFVVAAITLDEDGSTTFGAGQMTVGDQTTGQQQSQRYPLMDLEVASFGSYGNDIGLRVWAPNILSTLPLDDRLLASRKVYPFRVQCVERADSRSTPVITRTLAGENYLNTTFKENVIDPVTDQQLSIQDVFIQAYQDLDTPNMPKQWGPFGRVHVYTNSLEQLLQMLVQVEIGFEDSHCDMTNGQTDLYMYNLFGLTNSDGTEYHGAQPTGNGVRLSENTTLYATGGTDGTMDEATYSDLVALKVAEYADANAEVQDRARYPESVIYDSGFPLSTKYALLNFMSLRKDTAVVLSTHVCGSAELTLSQESALGAALRARAQGFPESEYYGTPTMRCLIMGGSGKYIRSSYRNKLPLTIELAKKSARYMGGSNGKWKSDGGFDRDPANNIDYFTGINVTFRPYTVRNKDWANGLNYVESYDRRRTYWAALQTVYENDTSVLNGIFAMYACVELQKIGDRTRRKFSGRQDLTNAQLIEKVNDDIIAQCVGKFDNRFVIIPDTYFTAADIARGFSWTTVIKLYSPNMKTAGTLTIEAHRIEELQAA